MALSVEITRTELSLADLELNAGDYRWSSSDAESPGVIWDRSFAESPYVVGRTLTHAKKAMVIQPARIIVTGSDQADLRGNIDLLVDAFSQFDYSIVVAPDSGSGWTWTCEPADYSTGVLRLWRDRLITDVTLSIPRRPDPFAGSLF